MPEATPFTLAAQYLRLIGDELADAGGSMRHWLALGGLSLDALDDPAFALTYAQFERLLIDASAQLAEPAVGLFVGQRLRPSTHGALGYAIMNCRTLREVLELTQRYLGLRAGFLSLSFDEGPASTRVVIGDLLPPSSIRPMVLEAVVSTVKQAIDAVAIGLNPVRGAVFPFADPGYGELAGELLGCPPRYGADWTGLELAPGVLDVPLRLADPEALRMAEQLCQRELETLDLTRPWSARVRRLLLERRHVFPSMPTAARLLRVTPRTLHRRLVAEGTAYRAIVDDLRFRIAAEHLEGGRVSVEAIAYVLGYANPANFRRAFKRWSGETPSAYRARVGAQNWK